MQDLYSCCWYTMVQFITRLGFHLKRPLHCYLTFYQSLEDWAKFFHFMLWGIHLTNRCIVDLCTAVGSDISSVQMYVRQLIFQSINDSLLCFSCPPWTLRAAPGTTGFFSWLGVFSRGCLRNSRQAVGSTCVLIF